MTTTHKELLVQMQINRSNADAGDSGANVFASAMISVLVTQNGIPVTDLGSNLGDAQSETALPAGWALFDGFNVRPGGSIVTVTQFLNQGGGVYDIRIVPFINNPASTWLSGEYIYALSIDASRLLNGRRLRLQGSALAKLSIL